MNNKGISIVEALIALLVLSLGMVGAASTVINNAAYTKISTQRIVAQSIAQGEIGRMRVAGFKNVQGKTGLHETEVVIDEGAPDDPRDSVYGKIKTDVTPMHLNADTQVDMLKLEVTVEWHSFGRTHEQKASSLLTRRSF